MTTLGIEMTDREPTTGWAQVRPVIHPQNTMLVLALNAWKLAEHLADKDDPDWEKIKEIQDIAQEIESLADEECNCTPRDYNCRVCNAVARLYNNEDYKETE